MNFFPESLVRTDEGRTMGIRPEDLFLDDNGALAGEVSHVEKLGGDTNVIAHVGDHQITARLFGQHDVATGETLRLGFTPESTYTFDQNGARLQ